VLVRDNAPELHLVRDWLDNWSGIGFIVAGMSHQGWDLQLTAYAALDRRANFFLIGIAHSIVGGTAWSRRRGGRCSGRRGRC
jgi:PhoPQ-activated pathogenicity-related protein